MLASYHPVGTSAPNSATGPFMSNSFCLTAWLSPHRNLSMDMSSICYPSIYLSAVSPCLSTHLTIYLPSISICLSTRTSTSIKIRFYYILFYCIYIYNIYIIFFKSPTSCPQPWEILMSMTPPPFGHVQPVYLKKMRRLTPWLTMSTSCMHGR